VVYDKGIDNVNWGKKRYDMMKLECAFRTYDI